MSKDLINRKIMHDIKVKIDALFFKHCPTIKTITSNYTILNTDSIICVNSSGGAFTIKLEASPKDGREVYIMDCDGTTGVNNVTIDGNGNNIIGFSSTLMNTDYMKYVPVFNGDNWNL